MVLLPVIAYLGFHLPGKAKKRTVETPPTTMVRITTDPPDSSVTSDGNPIASGAVPAGTTIEVSRLGYKSKQVQIQSDSDGKVSLEPEPFHLSVHTSGSRASAQLDGQNLSDFTDGSLEYDLASDGTVHTFTVSANGKHMFTLIVQSSAGQQPRVTGLDANDLLAIASLGNQATMYGATNLGDAHIGDQSVAINPSGAPFTLSDQNHDVVFGQGENQASASIDISNAPTLVVQSLHAEGRVLITTNADKAVLTVDGSPLPRQNRGWTVSKAPGPHKFTLSADGYEPQSWTMKIQRHGIVNKKIMLHTKVDTVALAGLNITGGTPGAEVALDGKKVGELDSSGNLNLANVVALGKHIVSLSKPGLEPREFEIAVSPSAPGKPLVDAQLSKPLLSSPTGTMAFEASVKGVAIKYRREGDAQFHEANLSEKVRLQPGQYEIVADAPGYQRFNTTVNLAKEDVTVSLNMTSIPDYEFEDPTQISHEGAWIKSKAPGRFVNLKPGRLSENLVFARPGKTLFWDKKVEWFVDNPAHNARVQYSLEGQSGKLTRRLMTGQDTLNQKEAKVDAQAVGQKDTLSLHIRVEGSHIRITNDKGVVMDDFTAPAHDFSGGRIGVRSDSLFLVRSNNQ